MRTHLKIISQARTVTVLATVVWGLFITCAGVLNVHTANELIEVFSSATGTAIYNDISLRDDLDFSSSGLSLPLGVSNGTCVTYSGMFHGNGHSIKGLVMNNTGRDGFQHAGLFCKLENAIIMNLAIDSSCSFVGKNAGALSVAASGSLRVINTTNMAQTVGEYSVGGFIGTFERGSTVQFEDCHNRGHVTGFNSVGGFVGAFLNHSDANLSFSNCSNEGEVSGYRSLGGFLGAIATSDDTNVTISSSTNNGNITGMFHDNGGFVGLFNQNENMRIEIKKMCEQWQCKWKCTCWRVCWTTLS